ncbi:MAG: beta strand repeat-containing protein, partial [Ferruginibacter sp.]
GLSASAATNTDAIRGINITSTTVTSTNNVYFNTVYLAGSGGLNFGSTGIYHIASTTTTTAALDLRSNIIVNATTPNGTGLAVVYRRSLGTASALSNYAATSNNNLFYAGTPGASNLIYSDGTSSAQTMAEYKAGIFTAGTVSSRDALSVSENPSFLSLVGANANYLHIDPAIATQIESGAGSIAGITDDYDGDVRNVSTPDIGADEGTFALADLSAPLISYTILPFTCGSGNRTLTASITDASGVPTSGSGLPVLYWKINAGAYNAATGVYVSGSNYSFTFGAGVVAGDVVSYYIVAQDNAGIPNVGAFPSAGAAGLAIDPPSASTAPTTPSSYSIRNTLSGTYTVGAAGTYTTLTAAIAAYNNNCLGGPVVFSLIDAAYTTTSDTIRVNADASATNTLTIKPTIAGTTITGNTTTASIVFLGADYVTIDGSISNTANTVCPANSASRDLSIINSNASTASAVIWIRANGTDGANNNTIKNCNITGSGSAATILGIGSGGATIGGAATTAVSNNNSIVNNNISRVQIGIYSAGINAASKNNGTVISQNLINSASPDNVSRGGIAAFSENNISVTGNNVSGMALISTADAFGISLGTLSITTGTLSGVECTNAVISKNIIGSVRHTATYSAFGILLAPGSTGTSEISNNMVSGVSSNGTSGDFGVGIFVLPLDGSSTKVYHNTVSMSGTQTGGSDKSYALAIAGGTTPTVDIKNNIFINKQNNGSGLNYAIGFGYTVFTNISTDNNGLFAASGSLYSLGATSSIATPENQLTLANWQTATSKDANSKNEDATFV